MNLCIDIGNTRLKAAWFDNEKRCHYLVSDRVNTKELRRVRGLRAADKIILSSSRKIPKSWIAALGESALILDHKTSIPIKNGYKSPETLGKDRLAAVIGAWALKPNRASLVIDIGTCMTFDFINSKGLYKGGNISPGIEIRLKGMHTFTDALPLVDRRLNKTLLGTSTEKALQNGAVLGLSHEIEGFITALKQQHKTFNIFLTGGDAIFFEKTLKSKIFVNQHLVLIGLNEILHHNALKG